LTFVADIGSLLSLNLLEEAAMLRTVLLLISLAVAGFASSMSFTLAHPGPTIGTPFEVVVELNADQALAGYQFDLMFTPNLQVLTITQTGFFLAEGLGLAWTSIDNTNRVVTGLNDVAVAGGGVIGSDSLMRIEFLATEPGSATLEFANLLTIDENFEIVTPSTQSLTFFVAATPPPTPGGEVPEPAPLTLAAAGILLLVAKKSAAAWRKAA
jgi:hypothetical protein